MVAKSAGCEHRSFCSIRSKALLETAHRIEAMNQTAPVRLLEINGQIMP